MEAFLTPTILCEADLIPKREHGETGMRCKRARNRLKMLAEFNAGRALWLKYIIGQHQPFLHCGFGPLL